jgi:PAS domain S-box-containing protein
MAKTFPERLARLSLRGWLRRSLAHTDRRGPTGRISRLLVVLSCGVVLVVFLALLTLSLVEKRSRALSEAARTAHNLVRTLDEQATGNIRGVQIMLDGFAERIIETAADGKLEPQRVGPLLHGRLKPSVEFDDIAVLDADGRRVADFKDHATPLDLGNRDFFLALRSGSVSDYYISLPFFSSEARSWSLGISRPLRHSDGSFFGIVLATIDLHVFEAFYASLDLGLHGNVTLWDGKGERVLARYPADPKLFSQVFNRGPLYEAIGAGAREGTFRAPSPLDGLDRILSFRRVADLPLVVSVAISSQDVLAGWRRDLWSSGIGAAIGSLVLIVLAGLLLDQFGRLRASEVSVRTSEQRFRDFAETASDFYWETDAQQRFTFNSQRTRMSGGSGSELIGLRPDTATPTLPEDVERLKEHMACRERHEPFTDFVYGIRKPSGEIGYSSVSGKPMFDDDGNFTGYRGTGRDVTQQRLGEARLREAKTSAEAASRAKSQFLAGMSHELRTPLNAIIGFSDMLLSEILGRLENPKAREYLTDIHSSGQHLLRIINDILEVSRIEAGRIELHDESLDVDEVVASCLRFVRQRAAEGGVRLNAAATDGLPQLYADETRLKQILINLLSNAVKFTPRGGEVAVLATLDARGDMVIAVHDSGIGMSPGEIDIALQPFRQVDSSLARRYEGTGLGLPLTIAFVEAHGGHLVIDSVPGKGTTVSVVMPAERLGRAQIVRLNAVAGRAS